MGTLSLGSSGSNEKPDDHFWMIKEKNLLTVIFGSHYVDDNLFLCVNQCSAGLLQGQSSQSALMGRCKIYIP